MQKFGIKSKQSQFNALSASYASSRLGQELITMIFASILDPDRHRIILAPFHPHIHILCKYFKVVESSC